KLPPERATELLGKPVEHEYRLLDLLRRPGIAFDTVEAVARAAGIDDVSRETLNAELGPTAAAVIEQVEIGTKYAGYIEKQNDDVRRAAHYENLRLPADLDYAAVPALSIEVRQRLDKLRPETLG